jgi:hypothetical protein
MEIEKSKHLCGVQSHQKMLTKLNSSEEFKQALIISCPYLIISGGVLAGSRHMVE